MQLTPNIRIIHIPFDANSSFMRGPSLAPEYIQSNLFSPSGNSYTELGTDLQDHPVISLHEQLDVEDYFSISSQIIPLLAKYRLLSLGGDHSITYQIIKAHASHYGPINILQFDAHADLYDSLDNNPYSHACPFARIMEEGFAKRLVQVGIRTMTKHLWEQAKRFKVEVIEMGRLNTYPSIQWNGPVYISLDLDVLDPAYAPGVSHYEPGGISTRQLLEFIHQINVPIIGADIVEYNPARDINGLTAMVAAKFMKELLGKMIID